MFVRDRQVVDLQCAHVRPDGFLHVGQRGILRFALGDAAGQAGALGDPKAIFPAIDENLSHAFIMPDSDWLEIDLGSAKVVGACAIPATIELARMPKNWTTEGSNDGGLCVRGFVQIQIAPQLRILVAIEAIDGRKGIDSLALLCREKLAADPHM